MYSSSNPFTQEVGEKVNDDDEILSPVKPSKEYAHLSEPTERLRDASLDMLSTGGNALYPEQKALEVGVAAAAASNAPPPHPPGFQYHLHHVFRHAKNLISGAESESTSPQQRRKWNGSDVIGIIGHTGAAIHAISKRGSFNTDYDESTSSDGEANESDMAGVAYPTDVSNSRGGRKTRKGARREAAWVRPAKAIAQVAAQAAVHTAAHHLRAWAESQRK